MSETQQATSELVHTVDVLRAELHRVRKAFQVFANHLDHCQIPETQVCTCGFAEMAKSVETGEWNPTT